MELTKIIIDVDPKYPNIIKDLNPPKGVSIRALYTPYDKNKSIEENINLVSSFIRGLVSKGYRLGRPLNKIENFSNSFYTVVIDQNDPLVGEWLRALPSKVGFNKDVATSNEDIVYYTPALALVVQQILKSADVISLRNLERLKGIYLD